MVQDLLLGSWVPKTQTNYNSYIRKWLKYCIKEGMSDPYMASYDRAISFLSNMFYDEKGKHRTIAVARSSLSAILQKLMGKHLGRMTALAG